MIIYNAKLVTMAGDDIENGFIEIKNGKISNIGTMQQLKPNLLLMILTPPGLHYIPDSLMLIVM